jgi:hypothetical protein
MPIPSTYRERDKDLLDLGFPSYPDYLDSELWKIIRKVVFQRDNYQCQIDGCSKRGRIEAHHVTYSRATLLGVNPGGIVTLCRYHHRLVEYSGKRKLTLEKVQRKTVKYFRVGGNRKPKSVADWLRYRFKEQPHIARRVFLLLRPTDFYSKILAALHRGSIPKEYYDYLRVER